jgi:hypothetical protein
MGMCHIALAGQFAGMVCTNSLVPVAKRRETVKTWAKRRAAVAPQTAGGGL